MSTSGPVPIRIFIVILLASLAAFFGCGGGESSPTAAPTATPIVSPAATGTATPLATATPVHTVSPSPSPTTSPTPTASPTSSPTPTPESGSTATLSTPEGEVLTQEQGSEDWQDAASGTKLSAGDIIRTGEDGYALLIFLDGSVLEVEANSEIRIEELSSDADTGSTTVRLWQTVGKTVSRVGQLVDPASRYEVETPAASAVVRGTIFDLQVLLSGLTTIWSQQGNIAFGGGNVTVTVGAGTRSSCSIGGTPSTPVSYLGGGGSGGSHPELEVSCAADPQSAEVGHDIQFDCTASGGYPDYAYAWDFGDGQGSEERKPTYAYAAAGNYTPCVTVADSRNNSEECCTEISVFPALSLDCSAAPNPTKVGHEVDFTCSPTGGVTPYTFLWQFGDGGTSDLQNPSHTYASAGNRHVCITVTDSLDNVEDCCFDITVNPPLNIQDCSAAPNPTKVGHQVDFTCSPTGGVAPYTFLWDFGDGNTGDLQDPSYTYAWAGDRDVCITVTDDLGNVEDCCFAITVNPPLGIDDCRATPNPTKVGHEVDFTCSPTGGVTPYTFLWDFGDGNTSDQQNPSYAYLSAGNYTACVRVDDALQNVEVCCVDIAVNPQPLVDITSPQDGSTLYEKLLYIEGVVQSAYEIQEARVTHNGQSRGLELVPEGSNGYLYTFNTPLELFQGWNQIAVTAIDSEGQSGNDSVLVYGELPICAIKIELSWTSDNTDFDSHLLRPGGIYNQVPDDCCYFNRNPDWDGTGSSTPGDPALDVDDTDGYGPEYIVLCDSPYDGIYEYKVHYFSDHGYGPDTASVKIWIRDELAFEDTRVLSDGELWDCAHIEWPSGDVFAELPD